jgi:hypothetical protein
VLAVMVGPVVAVVVDTSDTVVLTAAVVLASDWKMQQLNGHLLAK